LDFGKKKSFGRRRSFFVLFAGVFEGGFGIWMILGLVFCGGFVVGSW